MNQKERMLAGLPYKAWLDGLGEERLAAKTLTFEYNRTHPADQDARAEILRKLLGRTGNVVKIEPPFQCDYGWNIELGENFYANHNLVVLDVGRIRIGRNAMLGPNVSLVTAGHPIHHRARASGYEYGIGIEIGDDVWLGSNVVVNPGVTIGSRSVIGSGSVVTRDVPEGVIAFGNPCRVVRSITERDRNRYFRDREFDVDDHLG